jgi:hypothetical protein
VGRCDTDLAKGGPLNEAIDGVPGGKGGLVFRPAQEAKLNFCLHLWLKKIVRMRGETVSAEILKMRFVSLVASFMLSLPPVFSLITLLV